MSRFRNGVLVNITTLNMRNFIQFALSYMRNIFSLMIHGLFSGARSFLQPRHYLCPRLHMYNSITSVNKTYMCRSDLLAQPKARDLYEQLLGSIMQNDARQVRDIIGKDHFNVLKGNQRDIFKESDTFPLLLATMLGNSKIVRLLLEAGVDANEQLEGSAFLNTRSPTALHQAVEDGNLQITQILTRCGQVNIDAQNYDGETGLHIAVEDGAFEIVNVLLIAGCNVNILDNHGNNALHVALSTNRCSAAVIKALVSYGVDINLPYTSGITPVKYAALTANLYAVGVLLASGCQLQYQKGYLSPLEAAVLQRDVQSVETLLKAQKIVSTLGVHSSNIQADLPWLPYSQLCDQGSNSKYEDESVHTASRYSDAEIMSVVLKYKYQHIDCFDFQGETPLFIACRFNNLQTLKVLLANGAQVNKCSLHGISCLCKATLDCNLPLVLELVTSGAHVDYGIENNSAAIHKALFCGFHYIASVLIQCGCTLNNSALHLVLSSKDWALMPLIHAAGYHYFARTVAIQMVKHERQVNPEYFDWAVSVLSGPTSLQHQCRVVIRSAINSQLYTNIQTLNLPKLLKQYVLLGPLCSNAVTGE